MIPKILHYVWVGNNPKPQSVIDAIATWKKHCPDYQIIEWGNDCLNKISCQYVREAYEARFFAFVSDYIRLYALQNMGGIYLDTDVELKESLDCFLDHDFFIGCEKLGNTVSIQTALIGTVPQHKIICDLLDEYHHIPFKLAPKTYDTTPNPQRFCSYFKKKFQLNDLKSGEQKIALSDKELIYPYWYFCKTKENQKTYAIHHFDGSWQSLFTRKLKARFFNFSLISIKKRKKQTPTMDTTFPIERNEKILLKLPTSRRVCLYFIYQKKD